MAPTPHLRPLAERLEALTNAELAQVYNAASPERQVTKFSDHTTAVRRTLIVMEERHLEFRFENGEIHVGPVEQSRPLVQDYRTITLLVDANPKTEGSKSEARFALYRDGMTIAEYIAGTRKLGATRRRTMRDIFWDQEHGYIRINE